MLALATFYRRGGFLDLPFYPSYRGGVTDETPNLYDAMRFS